MFLHRSTPMMTAVSSLGIGAAIIQAAWIQGPGMAVWRSSRIGKNPASGLFNLASVGSLLVPSTQVICVWCVLYGSVGSDGVCQCTISTTFYILIPALAYSSALSWGSLSGDHQLQFSSRHRPKPQCGCVLRRHGKSLGERKR